MTASEDQDCISILCDAAAAETCKAEDVERAADLLLAAYQARRATGREPFDALLDVVEELQKRNL